MGKTVANTVVWSSVKALLPFNAKPVFTKVLALLLPLFALKSILSSPSSPIVLAVYSAAVVLSKPSANGKVTGSLAIFLMVTLVVSSSGWVSPLRLTHAFILYVPGVAKAVVAANTCVYVPKEETMAASVSLIIAPPFI